MASRFFYGLGGLVIVGIVLWRLSRFFDSRQGTQKYAVKPGSDPSVPLHPSGNESGTAVHAIQARQKPYDPAAMQDFERAVQKFRHDSLAFFIYDEANEQGLSVAIIEKLFEQYGRFSIKPSFLPYLPKSLSTDSRLTTAVVEDWFKENGVGTKPSQWESAFEKYIRGSTQKEAAEIVTKLKNGSHSL